MKLSTWDLQQISICPRRWDKDKSIPEERNSPARELIRKIFLTRALGRETGWTMKGIASAWDQIFWKDKEITRQTINDSVRGVLAARKLYNKLPSGDFKIFSAGSLDSMIDSSILLTSVGDFVLAYEDRIETWVYRKATPKEVRRSILPSAEHYLLQKKVRMAKEKPFFLVSYFISTSSMKPIHFRIRNNLQYLENEKIVLSLSQIALKSNFYPSAGSQCEKCKVNC